MRCNAGHGTPVVDLAYRLHRVRHSHRRGTALPGAGPHRRHRSAAVRAADCRRHRGPGRRSAGARRRLPADRRLHLRRQPCARPHRHDRAGRAVRRRRPRHPDDGAGLAVWPDDGTAGGGGGQRRAMAYPLLHAGRRHHGDPAAARRSRRAPGAGARRDHGGAAILRRAGRCRGRAAWCGIAAGPGPHGPGPSPARRWHGSTIRPGRCRRCAATRLRYRSRAGPRAEARETGGTDAHRGAVSLSGEGSFGRTARPPDAGTAIGRAVRPLLCAGAGHHAVLGARTGAARQGAFPDAARQRKPGGAANRVRSRTRVSGHLARRRGGAARGSLDRGRTRVGRAFLRCVHGRAGCRGRSAWSRRRGTNSPMSAWSRLP